MPNKNYQVMDYNTLTQQIIDYSNMNGNVINDQFTLAIPYFIFQAQVRIWREAKDIGFEKNILYGQFTYNDARVKKPANWNKTISFSYGTTESVFDTYVALELHTYEYCRSYWRNANDSDPKNPPLYYSDHALLDHSDSAYDGFFISPTPDQTYYYELVYLCTPNYITDTNDTNILTVKFPDLLFYACMAETIPYLIDDERIPVFEQMYQRALKSVNDQTTERYTDRTSKRDKD